MNTKGANALKKTQASVKRCKHELVTDLVKAKHVAHAWPIDLQTASIYPLHFIFITTSEF